MKRVLMIIPNLDFGGAQKSFARITSLLGPHYETLLVVFNKDNIAPLTFGAPLEELNVKGSSTYLGKIISFIKRVKKLKEIKRKFKPDVSISFLEGADYVNLLSRGTEQIWFYIHGSKIYDRNIRGLIGFFRMRFFLPYSFSKSNKILVVNSRIREELIQYFSVTKVPIIVMKNFFDLSELDQLAKENIPEHLSILLKDYPTICISGRIAPEKGIDHFIKAFPFVLSRIKNLKLLIVGEGPYREKVIATCKSEGIDWCFVEEDIKSADFSKTIFFLGYKKNPYPFIKEASVLALPSLNEGMPNSIAEALILGTPVIASDCPYGPREMLGKDCNITEDHWPYYAPFGILLPVPDQSDKVTKLWAEAIIRLFESPELRQDYSVKGLTQRNFFSKETILSAWTELLKEV